ncbi:hypothetical protein [uncultured Bilophila sp.]|uniref:hypothetical protein n=1 Tax=uncultured Bilophila sp. TaxID=529385 RepID=UPI00280B199F|nr:hypothetical protein [uncultured Bilophila sp.]
MRTAMPQGYRTGDCRRDIRLFGDFLKIILYHIWLNIGFVEDVNVSCHPLVASHSVKGTGAFSEAPVLFAFGAFGAETLAPSGGPGVFFRFCYSMWLFHLHRAVKIRPFFRFSPWRDPRPRHFAGYPFGASGKKASAIFYTTAIF